ncbi:mechanosensitive ion channel family protein [Leptonema illini]|uniref:MscS Mechanosensitive ion channel n=1 Tax=Leptonema illini DSM 21528 TaxID=929563 RepID=H2CFH1_9LEPT|nr:mechanosensitive ion channel domain-containing protein [Leptonema illini]EHQ07796.1 MscS Mechanosensitive ion channel [Leptonema illini DSM 21528]
MNELLTGILSALSEKVVFQNVLYTSVLVAVIVLARWIALRFLRRRLKDRVSFRHWKLNTGYLAALVFVMIALPLWLPSLQGIAAIIGIFGAGILIVNKEILMNISGWFYVVVRKPFEVGNRIGIMDLYGDVIDIRLMDFTIIETAHPKLGGQSTGRVVHIPNSALLTQPLSNASKEFAFNWNEIRVPVTLKSDWQKALAIIESIAAEKLERISVDDERLKRSEDLYLIKFNRVRPIVYVEYRGGAVLLTIRHLCEPKNRRILTDQIWREILLRFATENDIHLHEHYSSGE